MFKLLVFDLDGTLLGPDHRIVPQAAELLAELAALGIPSTLATGRSFRAARPFAERLKIRLPLILYNGALLVAPRGEQVLYERRLSRAAALTALELLSRFKIDPQVYLEALNGTPYIAALTPAIGAFLEKDGYSRARIVPDLHQLVRENIEGPFKLLLIGEREELLRFNAAFLRRGPEARTVLSERNFLEILAPGVSKGRALQELLGLLGLKPEQVLAFGDNLNDLELLTLAGRGVALAHAPDELKTISDLVTPSVIPVLQELLAAASARAREEVRAGSNLDIYNINRSSDN